jgi:hypothetical protein
MHTLKWLVFCATVLPLVLTPGPDIIYITTRGIAQGRWAALVSTLGVCGGMSSTRNHGAENVVSRVTRQAGSIPIGAATPCFDGRGPQDFWSMFNAGSH